MKCDLTWLCFTKSNSFRQASHRDGYGTAPAVADGLEIIVGGGDVAVGFLGFDVEFHPLKIRREVKGVVGPPLRKAVFLALDLDLLFEGILLGLVIHVPAEGEPEFVNEVAIATTLIRPAATFSHPMGEGHFLIGRGKVEFLVGPKIRHKRFNPCKSCIKPGWHGGSGCAPKFVSVNAA